MIGLLLYYIPTTARNSNPAIRLYELLHDLFLCFILRHLSLNVEDKMSISATFLRTGMSSEVNVVSFVNFTFKVRLSHKTHLIYYYSNPKQQQQQKETYRQALVRTST